MGLLDLFKGKKKETQKPVQEYKRYQVRSPAPSIIDKAAARNFTPRMHYKA